MVSHGGLAFVLIFARTLASVSALQQFADKTRQQQWQEEHRVGYDVLSLGYTDEARADETASLSSLQPTASLVLQGRRCFNWGSCQQSNGCSKGRNRKHLAELAAMGATWISCEEGSVMSGTCSRYMLSGTCDTSTQDDEHGWNIYMVRMNYGGRRTTTYDPTELEDDSPSYDSNQTQVRIYGMYNTGTNLVTFMMGTRHPHANVCPHGEELYTRDRCHNYTGPYKHANPAFVQEWLSSPHSEGIRAILMVRNPFSWLASMKRHPYGLASCIGSASSHGQDDAVTAACTCRDLVGMGVKDRICARDQVSYASMADVWNQYVAGYKQAATCSGRWTALVRYEDLVLEPTQALQLIDTRIVLAASEPWQAERLVEQSVKSNGRGRGDAMQEIRHRSYRQSFSSEELEILCRLLDKALLLEFGYAHECSST
eukprot:CAMPEP_0117533660 /NCGR_PEP_ID=MMETSP0784-20121206/40007_1 /TAXON_ID=39447 /ORGANISM="" /LENGTH=427 /DNA_ID=CAMNT_0005330109 /DNA_START=56 /DNA_END=1339 /DNA_ORIENTATION=+